jgi:hypothetical protein
MNDKTVFLDAYQRRVQLTEAIAEGAELSAVLLGQHVQQLERTVVELSATVSTLVALLTERSAIDRVELDAKVEAALDAVRAKGPQVMCTRCRRTLPARLTEITPEGPLCDVCAAMI